jgi:hypothetical protein
MTRRPWFTWLTIVGLASVLAVGCKPQVGGKCSGNVAVCTDKSSALFCVDDAYAAMSCKGDKGCGQNGAVVECDESLASEQETCNAPDAIACTPDHKEALRCTNKHFVVDETCKGPTGCKLDSAQKISCDNDIADVNDPCHFLGDYACTTDKSLVLKCEANKMTPLNTCRGPKQCRIQQLPKQDKVEFLCDDSIAQDGDACDTNGEEACSMDKKGMFVCRGNKFGSLKACPGGCTYEERTDRYTCNEALGATPAADPPPPAPAPGKRHGRR